MKLKDEGKISDSVYEKRQTKLAEIKERLASLKKV